MTERISLEGKVAVVTGAGRGLGRAYVELLAERGARVVVNDLGTDVSGFGKDSTLAEQVADLIRSRGGEAIANDSDVSSPEGARDLIATTIKHLGRIDLLVNNAGICGSQLFEDATLEDFAHYWRVHLGGPVNTVKAAWPHMIAQRYGKIILTTSVVGLLGSRGQATYAAAKCAVVGLMRILAIEGAEYGILVNTISPVGYTRMHPAAVADPAWLSRAKPLCRLGLWRQRSCGWQAIVVHTRTASRGSRSNPTDRYRHGTRLLGSTSDTRKHRRELRKGRIDRGLLRTRSRSSPVRRHRYLRPRVLRNDLYCLSTTSQSPRRRHRFPVAN